MIPIKNGVKPATASPSQNPKCCIPIPRPKNMARPILRITPSNMAVQKFTVVCPLPLINAFMPERAQLPKKQSTATGIYANPISNTSSSRVNSPYRVPGKRINAIENTAAATNVILKTDSMTFLTRSYFLAPIFCPTMDDPAVLKR